MYITDWNGYRQINFNVGKRESFVVCPKKALPGNPWVWRTEFFGAFDTVDRALLEKGWHLAYHRVSNMYGCPKAVEMMHEFYEIAVKGHRLSEKPALFGFSRGGLYAINFAAAYPECCGMLYLDAPVTDIRSWPAGWGKSLGTRDCWAECKMWYGLDDADAENFKGNALEHAEKNAADGIPVMLVCGGVDKVVPFDENGELYYNRYRAVSDQIELILKPDCDHHPHSLEDPAPVVKFIEKVYGLDRYAELKEIMEKFAGCGWELIAAPAAQWLNGDYVESELLAAIAEADRQCGSCGCEFDALYKRALELI